MEKEQDIQDLFLETLRQQRIPVSIFLRNGIKLQGTIEDADRFVVTLKNVITQMVFKHSISTVVPSRPVKLPRPDAEATESS